MTKCPDCGRELQDDTRAFALCVPDRCGNTPAHRARFADYNRRAMSEEDDVLTRAEAASMTLMSRINCDCRSFRLGYEVGRMRRIEETLVPSMLADDEVTR